MHDTETKELVQASRGQMTHTPKPWPDLIPTHPPPAKPHNKRTAEHIREVKARH